MHNAASLCAMMTAWAEFEFFLMFRMALQVAYLFRHTILKGLDPPGEFKDVAVEYRSVAFACLAPVCSDGQLLMDLYVNYDCDPDRSDNVLLERMFKGLINAVNNPDSLQEANSASPMTVIQRNQLRYGALSCISRMLHALFKWHGSMSGTQSCPYTQIPKLPFCHGRFVQLNSSNPGLTGVTVCASAVLLRRPARARNEGGEHTRLQAP
jgi:hypothetical protein